MDLSTAQVMRWSEERAYEVFCKIRFAATDGVPKCPHCSHVGAYAITAKQRSRAQKGKPVQRRVSETGTPKVRRLFKCAAKGCRKQFSATSGTIWHDRKMPIQDILAALMCFQEGRLGESALRLRRALGCSYTTALLVERRIREAVAASRPVERMTGKVFVDGTRITSRARSMNLREDNGSPEWRRYAKAHADQKLTIITVRQLSPSRITRTRIVQEEGPEAFDFAKGSISRNAEAVHTDEGAAWNRMRYHLKDRERHRTVNHSQRYAEYIDGVGLVTNNPNEAFHAFLKASFRGVYGRGVLYLQDYLDEQAWRVDHRYLTTAEQFMSLASACSAHPISLRWVGYYQGRKPTVVDRTNRLAAADPSTIYRIPPSSYPYKRAVQDLRRRRAAERAARPTSTGPDRKP